MKPVALQPKEGLALINGTQFISAIGSEAVVRAKECARVADLVAAFSVEVLQGTWKAYLPQIHAVRPHKGQISTARRVLRLLRGWKSEVSEVRDRAVVLLVFLIFSLFSLLLLFFSGSC